MVVKEFYTTRTDGVNLYRTFSDKNLYIKKIGTDEIYVDTIDVAGSEYTYEETDLQLPTESEITMLCSLS